MPKTVPGLVLLAAAAWLPGVRAEEVALARDGVALAKIVVAADAGKIERFAADELKQHLDRMTGGDFAIVTDASPATGLEIRVGQSARTKFRTDDFKAQQYAVSVAPDAIELVGYDRKYPGRGVPRLYDLQGTTYAVYEFLERDCGVRWLNPTDFGTYVPRKPTLSVRTGLRRGQPRFKFRGGAGIDNRYPLIWKRGSEGEKAYNDFAFASVKADGTKMRQMQQLFFLRRRAGGEYAVCGHSFYNWYERFWEKGNKNFEGWHPEYFAKKQPGRPSQLCYSYTGTVARAIADARDYFDKGGYQKVYRGQCKGYHYGENNIALEPMDGTAYCLCDECVSQFEMNRKKENSQHSTYWFRFVDKVARELKKSHPDKIVSTLAYSSHEGLPTDLRLSDNVAVHFCVSANRTPCSPLLQQQLDRMRQWRQAYPKMRIAMWLYNCFPKLGADAGNFRAFPGFFAHAAEREFRFFDEIDATEGVFYDGFNGDVDSYVNLALMLDPKRSADEILDEYFAPLGECGTHLKRFYTIIEERYCDPRNWPEGGVHENVGIAWGRLGTPEVMARLAAEFEAAEKTARTDFERNNVELVRLGVWNYMTEGAESYRKRSTAPMPSWTARRVPAAGGDPAAVDWRGVEPVYPAYFNRGSDQVLPYRCGMRLGHDGSHLYVEMTEYVDPSKLENAASLTPCDVWEFLIANRREQPFRYYFAAPDERLEATSYGEINWRQAVPSEESGARNFNARVKHDTVSYKDRWIARFSFPLSWAACKPLHPGDTFYLNIVRVLSPSVCGITPFNVCTFTSYTTVQTVDRSAEVRLEK